MDKVPIRSLGKVRPRINKNAPVKGIKYLKVLYFRLHSHGKTASHYWGKSFKTLDRLQLAREIMH